MKFQLTKKNALIAFAVFGLLALTIVIIILLKPGKNPDGCGSGYLCKKTDKCIDADMCTKHNLINKQADCNCTQKCDGTSSGDFPHSLSSFPRSTDINPQTGEPETIPQCGYICSVSDNVDKDGNKFCLANEVCGEVIYPGGHTTLTGCEKSANFKQCSWDDTTNTGVICPINALGDDPCSADKKSCKSPPLCDKQTKKYVCQSHDDCRQWDPAGNSTCKINKDPKLTGKGITKVGYCEGNSSYLADKWCTDIDNISQGTNDERLICTEGNGNTHRGVNMHQKCGIQVVDTDTSCTKFGLCTNDESIAMFDNSGSNCKNDLCCGKQQQIKPTGGGTASCCSVDVDLRDSKCYNTTTKPYSLGMLTKDSSKFADKIECDPNAATDICKTYGQQLIKNAGSMASTTKTDPNFVGMFCAPDSTSSKKGYCKAHCGYLSNNGQTTSISIENSPKGVSYCYPQDQCTLTTKGPEQVNGIPVCSHSGSTQKYWYPAVGPTGYSVTWDESFNNTSSCQITDTTCQQYGASVGANKSTVIADKKGKEIGCEFTKECEDPNYHVRPSNSTTTIPWKDLNDPTKLNNILPANTTWSNPIAQNPNSQAPYYNPTSSISNAAPAPSKCLGDTGGYMTSITNALTTPVRDQHAASGWSCDLTTTGPVANTKLLLNGQYCPNGVQIPQGFLDKDPICF